MSTLRIGMAGLDTSHVPAFAALLHDTSNEFHIPGVKITVAFPGGSPDFETSIGRVPKFTEELRDKHGVQIVGSLEDLRGQCDAVMLESVDGRVHLEQFRAVASWGLPTFIDKPLTISGSEAAEIEKIAKGTGVCVVSASALRFAEPFQEALRGGAVVGADIRGPMSFLDKCPGYFWYGIHSAEMLFAALGVGCREVLTTREENYDVIVGRWTDGRLGTLRGNRTGNNGFGGILHRAEASQAFDVATSKKPYYASMLDQVIPFLRGEKACVPPIEETVEIMRFLEAANRSAETRAWTAL